MAVRDHPMRALKGTEEARRMMDEVRSHRGGKPAKPAAEKPSKAKTSQPRSYSEIAAKHT